MTETQIIESKAAKSLRMQGESACHYSLQLNGAFDTSSPSLRAATSLDSKILYTLQTVTVLPRGHGPLEQTGLHRQQKGRDELIRSPNLRSF